MCCCTIPAALPLKFEAFFREAFQFQRHLAGLLCINQGDTNRCRLSWLTNSARVYEPKCGGREGLRGPSQWVQLYTEAQIIFGDLTPYLTYGINVSLGAKGTRGRKQLGPLLLVWIFKWLNRRQKNTKKLMVDKKHSKYAWYSKVRFC